MKIALQPGQSLRVVNGAVSEERNPRDVVLPPGQNLILRRPGP